MPIKNNNEFERAKYEQALRQLIDRSQLSLTPLHILPIIPSTNQYLWSLIEQKQPLPLAASALQQTAGRGQWGKTWQSSLGGLYLSVGMETNLSSDCYPHLIMATAWGIATVLRQYHVPVLLKWSNDLILLGKKLGGIKIETRTQQQYLTHAVVGVGINWANTVPDLGINLHSYYQTQTQTEPQITCLEQLTAITIYGVLSSYQHYLAVGIEQLRDDYLHLLSNLGQQITIEGCPGIVSGVTTKGELKVRLRSPGATTEICFAPGQISLGY
ncbi:MAG: biotin--[acetyl-CoA-carboxylase] ligase [Xenococcaceae cyanobacterium MO_188.B32]|nr:biotin--[acetyl-CoA-carboxylase] ligase [Xenococcaceae cyanobacterium MO_188.B32]